MLLFSFLAFIVHTSIFCLLFFQKQVQTSQKNTGEMFYYMYMYFIKSTCKNSGTFEGKQILPKKVTYVPLAPSHSIVGKKIQRVFSGIKCSKNKELKSECVPNSLNQLYFNWMESNSNVQCMILWSSFKWHFLQIIVATKTNFFKADVWFTSTVPPSNLSTS